MYRRYLIALSVFIGTLLFLVCDLFADGVLLVRPRVRPVPTPLAVTFHRVSIDINGATAVTRIDQEFRNIFDTDLEAEYIFPLPEDAAISDFALYMDGRRMSGEVLDSEKARRIYEEIVRDMRDPGLLEYVGRNMFRARVYPVPAHGSTRIELVYSETLHYDAGTFKYRYPLDTERFSPEPLDEVTITAEIESEVPIKNVYSPSHDIDIIRRPRAASVGYEESSVKPDRDFILYYTVSERDLGMSLLTFRNHGEQGYFLMMLSPGDLEGRSMSKDIVFVFDTSGSMRGEKLRQAREALRYCIDGLREGDRFNIVQFATAETPFKEGLVAVNGRSIAEAHRFIDGMTARGGTNINDALLKSLDMFSSGERPSMVVFLTDGEPTVGHTNLKDIVRNINRANDGNTRIFVFGVGNDVNTHLLDRIAEENRGVSEYVTPRENIEVSVSSFFRKVSEPILADIQLDFGKVDVEELYPVSLPDIFRGTQLILLGRYRGSGTAAVRLTGTIKTGTMNTGTMNAEEISLIYEGSFPSENRKNDFIPRLWATRKIGYLMGQIRLNGESRELVDEIIRLSREYGIMTPYTSFLVLEYESDYDEWGLEPSEELMSGGREYKRAMESEKGADAVMSARDIGALKATKTAPVPVMETIKHVGHKTFYLRDGFWVDSAFEEKMKVREIRYLSGAYFKLLAKHPGLGRYFALGGNVVVVVDSVCYRVAE